VDCKQFEYASRHCAIWRRAVLAARLPACTPNPRPTRPDKARGVGVVSKYLRARRRMHCFREKSLSCLSQLYATPTLSVDRQLGHSFATSKVPCDCLKVGLDFVSTDRQSHGTLGVLNEWPSCRSKDSVGVAYNCDKHDSDLLTHAVHSAPCSNLY